MKHVLVSNWDMVLFRGILAILFGIATLVMPGITLGVLVALFGAYALVDGIILSMVSIKDRKGDPDWWLMLLTGLVSSAAGVVTFTSGQGSPPQAVLRDRGLGNRHWRFRGDLRHPVPQRNRREKGCWF